MTPEERALGVCRDSLWTIEPWKYDLIVAAIREAVKAEREACAVLAEQWGAGAGMGISAAEFERRYGYHRHLSAAIRARGVAATTQEISPKTPDEAA